MNIHDFYELTTKHKTILVMLHNGHYVKKLPKEVNTAFEDLISGYNIDLVKTIEVKSNNNRRDIIVTDIIHKLKELKTTKE